MGRGPDARVVLRHPPARGWPQLAPVAAELRGADVAAVDYEGTCGSGGVSKCGGSRSGNCFAFQAPAANAKTLRRAGVDIIEQANNHAYDYGPAGSRATRSALARAGVRATGAPGEVQVVQVICAKGRRVAFVGFSAHRRPRDLVAARSHRVPRRDPSRGAEALMRRLSQSDFGSAGVWPSLVGARAGSAGRARWRPGVSLRSRPAGANGRAGDRPCPASRIDPSPSDCTSPTPTRRTR